MLSGIITIMETVNITINHRPVQVDSHATVLDACRQAGVHVPVLCHAQGLEPYESCMICVVEDAASGKIIPSCAAKVREGMSIRTDSDPIREVRKSAVEMLLSEHVGDCEAPCTRACPLESDIPGMIRALMKGDTAAAVRALRKENPLAGTISLVCNGPCENGCRRGRYDRPLLIRVLITAAVESTGSDIAEPVTGENESAKKQIAVVGAGISGLTAAWIILRSGYGCTVIDSRSEPGGSLLDHSDKAPMLRKIRDLENRLLWKMGMRFQMNTRVGRDVSLDTLRHEYDALLLAVGRNCKGIADDENIPYTEKGISISEKTRMTDAEGVFAAGAAVGPIKMAARASQDGKVGAEACIAYLEKRKWQKPYRRFDSRIGKLDHGEMDEFLKTCGVSGKKDAENNGGKNSKPEVERCFCCDCTAKNECKLRDLADSVRADRKAYKPEQRSRVERIADDAVIYEPGKCIRCGICVRKSRDVNGQPGLAFSGRGYETRIVAPAGFTMGSAIRQNAVECIRACPTGALYLRNRVKSVVEDSKTVV